MLILSKDDIILLQQLRIKQLNEAITELIAIVARQYDTIHKPKRIRRSRDRLDKLTSTIASHRTITKS